MKKCPKCQTTFGDDKRFCQIDGTPLVEGVEPVVTEDPYKTVVVGKQDIPLANLVDDPKKIQSSGSDLKEDDLLQLPEEFDPMKTMVVSEPIKFEKPVVTPPKSEMVVPSPEPPKFDEPKLTPPSFGDLSSNEPKTDPVVDPKATVTYSEKPKPEAPIPNPFSSSLSGSTPFSSPMTEPSKPMETPKFNANPLPSESPKIDSPFSTPPNNPIGSPFQPTPVSPAFKEPESPFSAPPSPFDSPFGQNDMSNQPANVGSAWTPPPAPVQSWGEQGVGQNTPFQPPPAGTGGLNQTLPIVSLVLGIISLCCYISPLTGLIALITGYLGMKNANNDPANYGGKGLAIAGMIVGGLFFLLGVCYYIYIFVIIGLAASGNLPR